MTLFTVLIVLSVIAIITYFFSQKRSKKFPPGPAFGFPLVGHLPLLGQEPFKTAAQWKQKYGPIIGINFASFPCVIISDYKLIKEAMNEYTFAGRPELQFSKDRAGGTIEGIALTQGKKWQELRRFTLRHLREFGFGKKSMEAIIQDEIKELIEHLKEKSGTPFVTMNEFNIAIVNALWTIVNGERFEQNDPKLREIIELVTTNISDVNIMSQLAIFMPWLAKYAPNLSGYNKLLSHVKPMKALMEPFIEYHFKTHEPNHPRDFIDIFIDEVKRNDNPNSSFRKDQSMSLLMTITDLFIAGVETTSTTLTWICLYLARHQHVQEKLAEEILRVVGISRLPSLTDRPQMPYTEAVIHEVLRKITLLPLAIMHSTTEDVVFHGYDIPKETMVLVNLHEAHNNIETWGDPENFRPERFLSADETQFVKQERFVPFSIGKRLCPGETLARDELFLFTTAIFQVFHVDIDKNNPPPTLEPHVGTVLSPKPHKLVFNFRNQ